MKSKINYFLLFSVLFIGLTACHKDENVTATINLMEPIENDTIPFGTELHMHGTIVGTGELHGYSLTLKNLTNDSIVYSADNTTHQETYAFDEHWVNNVTDTSLIQVSVVVEVDHDGNKENKTVNLVCLPQ
jgi:hypothetical protein